MKKIISSILVIITAVGIGTPVHAKELSGPKRRIAVTTFKDKSDHSFHYWANVGDGMADMLTTALEKTGKFIVVERNQLSSAVEEQALAKDGAVQAATGAKSGQLIGAGYIVTGAVTEFGIKEGKYGAGKLGTFLPIGGDASLQTETARVALDLRFYDTTTGQVIATEKAEGSKTSTKVQSDLDKMPSVEFGKQGFDETVIGKATREAIDKAVKLVEAHMEKTPWYGRIVKVDGSDVFINTGEEDGRKAGDEFQVVRAGETMMDPDTGEALGAERTRQGEVRILSVVGKRLSKAQIVSGDDIKVGDTIESGGKIEEQTAKR